MTKFLIPILSAVNGFGRTENPAVNGQTPPRKKPPPVPARKPQLYVNTNGAATASSSDYINTASVPRKPPRSKHDLNSEQLASVEETDVHFPSREATNRVLIGTLMLHNNNGSHVKNQRSGPSQRSPVRQLTTSSSSSLVLKAPPPQVNNGIYSNGILSVKRQNIEVKLLIHTFSWCFDLIKMMKYIKLVFQRSRFERGPLRPKVRVSF